MPEVDKVKELSERLKKLGLAKVEKKIERLEGRRFFFFLRLRFIGNKLRFLAQLP